MARSGPLLTEAQWKKIAPLLPQPPRQRQGAVRGSRTVVSWKEFCGFSAAVLVGRTCRRSIRILPRAGGGCGTETSRASG